MPTPGWRQFPLSDDPIQVLAHSPASRSALPITVLPITGQAEAHDACHPTTRIFVALQSSGQRWTSRARQTQHLRTAPRMIEMIEAGMSFDRCRWEGDAGRCVMVEFPQTDLEALRHGALRTLELPTRQELFDEGASRLAVEIARETFFGMPRGLLYVQGLCLALLG